MQREIKPYLPTQPAALPYKGAPRGIHDLIMQQVQREDKGVEGFVRVEPQYEPANMMREAPHVPKGGVVRNMWIGNITKLFVL